MHRLFLSLVSLVIAVSIGCASGSPPSSATPGPVGSTDVPMPAPTATEESPAAVKPEEFFLSVSSPKNESVVDRSSVEVRGSTTVDAVVTVNGQVIEVGPEGDFTAPADLEEGPNAIEIIASDFAGHEKVLALSVIYIP
jgi:hypothetical protein